MWPFLRDEGHFIANLQARQTGKTISKGTLAYHLDILVQGNILRRELPRNPDRTYSSYDTTEEATKTLTALGILIEQEKTEPATLPVN